MYTKTEIFNLALGALLLTKSQIIDADEDKSTAARTLQVHWDAALRTTLADLDLDGASSVKNLELLSTYPNDHWQFAFKYPSDCALFRRIRSSVLKDTRSTQIAKRIAVSPQGVKVIYTNTETAVAEYISSNVPLSALNPSAGLAVAYKLAWLSSALIAGKGATALKKSIQENYMLAKSEAQEIDRLENSNFDDDDVLSEFVEARLS